MAMVTDDVWVEYFSRLFGHAKSLIQVLLCAFDGARRLRLVMASS